MQAILYETYKKIKNWSQPEYTVGKPRPHQAKLGAQRVQVHWNQKLPYLVRSPMEPVLDSPISVVSSDSWPPSPPFVEEEDVLFPYWELAEEDLHCRECEASEFLSAVKQQLRDFWHYQHLLQRN